MCVHESTSGAPQHCVGRCLGARRGGVMTVFWTQHTGMHEHVPTRTAHALPPLVRSRACTLRRPAILHRFLPYHTIPRCVLPPTQPHAAYYTTRCTRRLLHRTLRCPCPLLLHRVVLHRLSLRNLRVVDGRAAVARRCRPWLGELDAVRIYDLVLGLATCGARWW